MKYTASHTNQISFPLGGIGTGCIGLSGTGRLIDWEIFGRPNKESYNGYSHFAVKLEKDGKVLDTRVLNGDLPPHYIGSTKTHWLHSGFGFGPDQITMAGFPHFKDVVFQGDFPIAQLSFHDETFPVPMEMKAFNPFIPSDDFHSSLPAAFFEFEVLNPTEDTLDCTIALSVQNPTGLKGVRNRFCENENGKFLKLECTEHSEDTPHFGSLCLATDSDQVSFQEYWYRGGWSDGIEMFWRDFTAGGPLKNRRYESDFSSNQQLVYDVGTLAAHNSILPGETKTFRFLLTWYYPNMSKHWEHRYHPEKKAEDAPVWKHYYAGLFSSAFDCADYILPRFQWLKSKTELFQNALLSSSLPAQELDAIASNLSTLKSPTVLRLTNGEFYGFEGVISDCGCCEGSCQHVWNYAYALPFLFPKLERTMRELEFRYSMREDGRMGFRLILPLGSPPDDFRACVDGQMGAVIKTYREWKICGNNHWLEQLWPSVWKALSYAWSPANEDQWDLGQKGIITGRQHHTLDMELFGANSWLESFYLCALKAAAEMAEALSKHKEAELCRELLAEGKSFTESQLYNGSYFHQAAVDNSLDTLLPFADQPCLHGDSTMEVYWNAEKKEMKYQIGEGCMIDQVIGQWHANNCGLGEILDSAKVKHALESIYHYNYHPSVRNIVNPWRLYTLNDEGGVMICTWPDEEKRPSIPLTYNSETMAGFEYGVAAHMVQEGMLKEAHDIVVSIRDRYDGYKRNPYNEIECGSNYARSMASYALLLAYSGFQYDMTKGLLGFCPAINAPAFRFFWSLENAWGMFYKEDETTARLTVLYGTLQIKTFRCSLFRDKQVITDFGAAVKTEPDTIKCPVTLKEGESLIFRLESKQ
ncbi:MAG: GH116 family glycosyl-hydrolase [Eubacteriales bacterium]|nr:GH116 family glycosyl-hydrolase [Eubacteriales bacterium]